MIKNIDFKRYAIEGWKAVLINLIRAATLYICSAILFAHGFLKMSYVDFKIEHASILGSGGRYSEVMIYLSAALLFFLLLSFFKIKAKNKMFTFSFITLNLFFIIGVSLLFFTPEYLKYYNYIFYVLIGSAVFYFFKEKKRKSFLIIPYFIMLSIILSVALLFVAGKFHNVYGAKNHYKHQGYHDGFFAGYGSCVGAETLWFKYNFIPVLESCYFNRYLENGKTLTNKQSLIFEMFYGTVLAYDNLLSYHPKEIRNYNNENAVKLYQIAVKSLEDRIKINSEKTGEKTKVMMEKFLELEKESYLKSFEKNPDEFIDYLRKMKKEEKISFFGSALLKSIEIRDEKNKAMDSETNNKIDFEEIESMYERFLESKHKSSLFNETKETKVKNRIDLQRGFDLIIKENKINEYQKILGKN